MSRLVNPQAIEGTRRESLDKDMQAANLLRMILVELRIMNLHLAKMSEMDVESEDVDLD